MTSRLLVIDDDASMGDLICRVARSVGYEAQATTDPATFLKDVDSLGPSHIAIDLQMPDKDGIELLRELGKRRCEAQILIVSGVDYRVAATAKRFAEEGNLKVMGTLAKPFQLSALRSILQRTRYSAGEITEADVHAALEAGEFLLVYQPKLDLAREQIVGAEALVRWWHEGTELWPPHRFLAVIEGSSLIDRFTLHVMRMAAGQALSWEQDGHEIQIAINLSAANIRDDNYPDRLNEVCQEAGVAPDRFVLEITETAAMKDVVTAMGILTRLRLKGFSLSIDDFGTGYSSLQQLQRMPFDELKIDRGFVGCCVAEADAMAIVNAVVLLGHALGLRIVAEGIEDAATYRAVKQAGCDLGQGYHIGRPLKPEDFEGWLARFAHLEPLSME